MKKFNLKKARAGADVCTKSGHSVRILTFDRDNSVFPIVALIENKRVACYTDSGKFFADKDSDNDLRMV